MTSVTYDEVAETKIAICDLLSKLEIEQVMEIREWFNKYIDETDPEFITYGERPNSNLESKASQLTRIAIHLRNKGVEVPSKEPSKLSWPTEGYDSDCNAVNTCEIDSFLYDDEDIDDLVEKGVIGRTYCPTCSSRDTVSLNFISHSLSRLQVQFLFKKLMPSTCEHVLDIGSRLGAIVYGASIFTDGDVNTIGVEIDADYAALATDTVRHFNLKNIEILRNDIRHLPHVFKDNQFIVMNNVFSFFLPKADQEECWEFLHTHMRPGTVLAHHPSVDKATSHLNLSFDINDWLRRVDTSDASLQYGREDVEIYEDMKSIVKYIVKEPKKQKAGSSVPK